MSGNGPPPFLKLSDIGTQISQGYGFDNDFQADDVFPDYSMCGAKNTNTRSGNTRRSAELPSIGNAKLNERLTLIRKGWKVG